MHNFAQIFVISRILHSAFYLTSTQILFQFILNKYYQMLPLFIRIYCLDSDMKPKHPRNCLCYYLRLIFQHIPSYHIGCRRLRVLAIVLRALHVLFNDTSQKMPCQGFLSLGISRRKICVQVASQRPRGEDREFRSNVLIIGLYVSIHYKIHDYKC